MDGNGMVKGTILAFALLVTGSPVALAQASHLHPPGHAAASRMSPEAVEFLAENDAAMERMMEDMHVAPTGDVDRDFVSMMIPHHQGAIDMARAVLRSSHNEVIRRLAQEIIVTQEDEIRAMRLAIEPSVPGPPTALSPHTQEH